MDALNPNPARSAPIPGWLPILFAIVLSCVSCGPHVITGRPPFMGIAGIRLADDAMRADFRIANQNEVAMNIEAVDILVTVDGIELASEKREVRLAIDANSTEEFAVEESPGTASRDLLVSLQNREVASLPFDLRGSVRTAEDGTLRFEQKGHLYPVPGKPGFFRSAVTQAEELRRKDKL